MASRIRVALIFIACCAVLTRADAQNDSKLLPPEPSCKSAQALVNTDLFGAWSLLLEGAGSSIVTRLELTRNPEFAESLAGQYRVGESIRQVFGDIEEGALELEESANGKDISALWKGRANEGSCGQTFFGTRRNVADQTEQNFVLRRPGW